MKSKQVMHRLKGVHKWVIERNKQGQFTGSELCECGESRKRNVWDSYNQEYQPLTVTTASGAIGGTSLSLGEMQKAIDSLTAEQVVTDFFVVSKKTLDKFKDNTIKLTYQFDTD